MTPFWDKFYYFLYTLMFIKFYVFEYDNFLANISVYLRDEDYY